MMTPDEISVHDYVDRITASLEQRLAVHERRLDRVDEKAGAALGRDAYEVRHEALREDMRSALDRMGNRISAVERWQGNRDAVDGNHQRSRAATVAIAAVAASIVAAVITLIPYLLGA